MTVLFYDGACGLCHLSVRLLLALDRTGTLRFAPLGGETFLRLVPEGERGALPDSLVLRTPDGRLRVRSLAVLEGLREAGWPSGAAVLGLLPRPLADRLYDGVARLRHRLFRRPPQACPVVPPPQRSRFLV
ncbi:MAG TPA: DCC1-like thiol-disulfide oxidoreductase family protein [Vicinamibacteria bacterium]